MWSLYKKISDYIQIGFHTWFLVSREKGVICDSVFIQIARSIKLLSLQLHDGNMPELSMSVHIYDDLKTGIDDFIYNIVYIFV